MKKALSRILEFFVSYDQRDKNSPMDGDYCICGALKPEVKRHEAEGSSKTESRLREI